MNRNQNQNKLRQEDQAVHDWYRFVQSFPPHLVRTYLERFGIDNTHTILDPFCGAGTTLVECKKLGIPSIGIEAHPMPHFASTVKCDWSASSNELIKFSKSIACATEDILGKESTEFRFELLDSERAKLLIKDSISPVPLRKALLLLSKINELGGNGCQIYGQLALAKILVSGVSNLKFGPEVGVGRIKDDAPVLESWMRSMLTMASDINIVNRHASTRSLVLKADAREAGLVLEPQSIDGVITSPPYPNEKDYTRTTRLESVVLGLINDRSELRKVKQGLLRSNTRGVYKADTDDDQVSQHPTVSLIAKSIEDKRVELGKNSGFERLYARVTLLYFGGMLRHLSSLRSALRPGAQLAYVLGDQASFLRVMIPTGQIVADIASSLGYEIQAVDLFRTRLSTVTGQHLREEVIVMKWAGY